MAKYSYIVTAFTANQNKVVLYLQDGSTKVLPTDELFTKQVVDKIGPALARGETVEIDLTNERINIFHEVEAKSKGILKFFRVAKSLLTGTTPISRTQLETIALPMAGYDLSNQEETIVAVVAPKATQYPNEADEVSQEELEAAAEIYDRMLEDEEDEETTIIVGAERLANQVGYFSSQDSTEALENFMRRVGEVQKFRSHSASELLDFLQKNDMPLTKDGSILAYKRLRSVGKNGPENLSHLADEWFVDTHTRSVFQCVGSTVHMKAEMVDPNRRNECSNGLHVGRRDYMGSFGGDTILLVKIDPEDVIAVPMDYGASKMRCRAYTIVAKLNDWAMDALVHNRPMTTNTETAQLLTRVLNNQTPPPFFSTEITGSSGRGLVFSFIGDEGVMPAAEPKKEEADTPVVETRAIEQVTEIEHVARINPAELSPEVIKAQLEAAVPANGDSKPVEMSPAQLKAKANWYRVKDGSISKSQLARECQTSARSLDRWAEKFNFNA